MDPRSLLTVAPLDLAACRVEGALVTVVLVGLLAGVAEGPLGATGYGGWPGGGDGIGRSPLAGAKVSLPPSGLTCRSTRW